MLSKSLNIIATILARNEADIIAKQIEHHLEQGISKIIFTDNNSTDETKTIASKYREVILFEESGDDHNQSKWVSQMAAIAFDLNPDWIIHLDADEFWYNLQSLKKCNSLIARSETMYMHLPPLLNYYLSFDHLPISQECKIAHRPIKNITITHGNHGVVGDYTTETVPIYRHHYPIRSFEQWQRKAKEGHTSLSKRGAICERWKLWSEWDLNEFDQMQETWIRMTVNPNKEDFLFLLKFWSPEMVETFKTNHWLPQICSFS